MKIILCVEDEPHILDNNRKALADNGYTVLTAVNLAEARECLSKQIPDAIILDIMLPDGSGLDLLKELRTRGSKIPVLMLTAWGKPSDVARGLREGANDYMSKPFNYEVLLARIEVMFRNVEQVPERVTRGALTLDVSTGQAFLNDEDILLTQKEFSLLLLFVQNENRVMSAEYLYEKVWHSTMNKDKQTVQRHISALRQKLSNGNFPYSINVIYGEGYKFEYES